MQGYLVDNGMCADICNSKWMKEKPEKWYTYRNNLSLHLKCIYFELSKRYHHVQFHIICYNTHEDARITGYKNTLHNKKKVEEVPRDAKEDSQDSTAKKLPVEFFLRIKNLTSVNFNKLELNKGLNYAPSRINIKNRTLKI